jgi:16S rRNA (guanine527-N7)-methyltransferase
MPDSGPFNISDQQIAEGLSPYAISPNQEQIARIQDFIHLLLQWNRSVSLTSITQPLEIVGRHFGESMFASKFIPVENCRLVDIGTGAGFPGLALKIACPEIQVTLIESNKKKCVFLSEVIRKLGLSDVEVLAERFEQIRPESIQANFIVSRAVGEFKEILRWSRKALARRGHLMFWLGFEDSTRIAATPGWTWQPATRLPDSQRRFILSGRPLEEPPKNRN